MGLFYPLYRLYLRNISLTSAALAASETLRELPPLKRRLGLGAGRAPALYRIQLDCANASLRLPPSLAPPAGIAD